MGKAACVPAWQHCSAPLLRRLSCWLQYLGDLGCEHVVFKNDEKTVEEIARMNPRGIMVSPGPGNPIQPCTNEVKVLGGVVVL